MARVKPMGNVHQVVPIRSAGTTASSSTLPDAPSFLQTESGARNAGPDEGPFLRSINGGLQDPDGFSGSVQSLGLPDLLQLMCQLRRTGSLDITKGRRKGRIWFSSGQVVHAECGKHTGEEAIYELLHWKGGSFETRLDQTAPCRTIDVPLEHLLLDSLRQLDEENREGEETEWDLSDDSSPNEGALTPPPEMRLIRPPFREALARLARTEGFRAALVVDGETGRLLDSEGGAGLDLETAAAGGSQVLRAELEALCDLGMPQLVEDILITLPHQYHLLRPCRRRASLFVYLVLDRPQGNLALARHIMAACEAELQVE